MKQNKIELNKLTLHELEQRVQYLKAHIPELQSELHSARQLLKARRRNESRATAGADPG